MEMRTADAAAEIFTMTTDDDDRRPTLPIMPLMSILTLMIMTMKRHANDVSAVGQLVKLDQAIH